VLPRRAQSRRDLPDGAVFEGRGHNEMTGSGQEDSSAGLLLARPG